MNEKLEEIRSENLILIIYCVLIGLYYYANIIEVNYIKYQDERDKDRYRLLLYIIFGTIFVLALYYTIVGINSLKEIENMKVYELERLLVIVNILALIASGIYLYVIYQDKNIDLEVTM